MRWCHRGIAAVSGAVTHERPPGESVWAHASSSVYLCECRKLVCCHIGKLSPPFGAVPSQVRFHMEAQLCLATPMHEMQSIRCVVCRGRSFFEIDLLCCKKTIDCGRNSSKQRWHWLWRRTCGEAYCQVYLVHPAIVLPRSGALSTFLSTFHCLYYESISTSNKLRHPRRLFNPHHSTAACFCVLFVWKVHPVEWLWPWDI